VPLFGVNSLSVHYGAIEAVRGIDFEVGEGEIVALLGANGAGKSSTLNALAGLVPVAGGSVRFDGVDITNLKPEALTPLGLALSPEGRRVFGTLTVAENLRMGAYSISGRHVLEQAWERVYDLFPLLYERRSQYAGTLSGGQQQMLAVGRALMSNPRLLFLDEPSLGLAPRIVDQVFELIVKLREQGVTLVVVEQNVDRALEIADRAYLLALGQIRAAGSASDLAKSGAVTAAYLGEA